MPEIYYFDKEAGRLVDASGGANNIPPPLLYQNKPTWEIHVVSQVSGTVVASDLSSYLTWEFAVDNDWNHSTDVMCKTLNANIDSSQKASGILTIKIDADTASFSTKIGTSQSISAWARLRGIAADGQRIGLVFLIKALNDPDPSGATPPAPLSDYYTKTEADAKYAPLSGANDIEITDASKGIILLAGTTRVRCRLDTTTSPIQWVFEPL